MHDPDDKHSMHHAPGRKPLLRRLGAGLLWLLVPNCRDVSRLTSEALDHPLPLWLRARLAYHRLFCKYCARFAEQIRLLHKAGPHLHDRCTGNSAPMPPDARERLRERLRRETV